MPRVADINRMFSDVKFFRGDISIHTRAHTIHTHTHTHTHTHSLACTHPSAPTTPTHAHTHAHTYTHSHTAVRTHFCAHIYTYVEVHTDTHTCTRDRYMPSHTCILCTYACTHAPIPLIIEKNNMYNCHQELIAHMANV